MMLRHVFGVISLLTCASALLDECEENLPEGVSAELKKAEVELQTDLKCDRITDGGNWIVFQQNIIQNSQLFTTGGWTNYSQGFGQKGNEDRKAILWLGLERLAAITNSGKWQLLIKVRWIENMGGVSASSEGWAIWRDFRVENAEDDFRLKVGVMTKYSNIPSQPGHATTEQSMSEDRKVFDPLVNHRGMKFSARDKDNDGAKEFSCASSFRSGWWFNACYHLDLNRDPPAWFDGTNVHFPKETVMAIRPSK